MSADRAAAAPSGVVTFLFTDIEGSTTDIAKMLGCSRATVYRYLAEDGAA